LRRSRPKRVKRTKRRKRGARRVAGDHVRVVDRGPNRCALCGGRIGKNDDRVTLGGHSAYAHMKCVIRYSFSVLRQAGAEDHEDVVKVCEGAGGGPRRQKVLASISWG